MQDDILGHIGKHSDKIYIYMAIIQVRDYHLFVITIQE